MASLNTVPPRMLRMVPFGDFHIFFSLNSVMGRSQQRRDAHYLTAHVDARALVVDSPSTLFSSGVMVAHLIPTLYLAMASAHSTVTAPGEGEREGEGRGRGKGRGGREGRGGEGRGEEREGSDLTTAATML